MRVDLPAQAGKARRGGAGLSPLPPAWRGVAWHGGAPSTGRVGESRATSCEHGGVVSEGSARHAGLQTRTGFVEALAAGPGRGGAEVV